MKRMILILAAVMCMLLSGCNSWMDGSYASVTPHSMQQSPIDQGLVKVSDYLEMRRVIIEMVESGKETGVFALEFTDREDVETDMELAVRHVLNSTPLGAYTVESITYEIGGAAGVSAVGITVTYNQNRMEIQRMRRAEDMDRLSSHIATALTQCEERLVVLVEDYWQLDINKLVREYAEARPDAVMEMPQVTTMLYPNSGTERILDISFTYQNTKESLRAMQNDVQPVFASAQLYVRGEDDSSLKYARLYSFLMERNQYRIETSNTPAYSLLQHGVGDSKAFARVFAAMCDRADLECYMVSGTWEGENRFWNIICVDGTYYHLDLLKSHEKGEFLLWSDEEMQGYVWDYSAFPACEKTESENSDGS